ncbi:MAG TPA: TraB/GumN family protein [Kofleriaceae bacterium]
MRLLVIGLVACHTGASCPVVPVPAAPEALLWRAERSGGQPIVLFGTFHGGGEADVPTVAWRALDGAAHFASELGDAEADPDVIRELARLPPGKGLDQQLAPGDWYDLRDALAGDMKDADLARARPWFALVRLGTHLTKGQTVHPEMDEALATRAKQHHLAVDALETYREQLTALDASISIADLTNAIHARAELACDAGAARAEYLGGSLPAMQKRFGGDPGGTLLAVRNARWLPKLEAYAQSGGAFVAIGVGHLVGDGSPNSGLLAALARDGFTVTRISESK